MDGSSCLEEGSSSDSEKRRPPAAVLLLRMGSGISAVLDPTPEGGADQAELWAKTTKLPSSRYKGVVPQPNGRWGAQIYDSHLRVWLGTFAVQDVAARAYDVAALRFRGSKAVTNFRPLSESDAEEAAELGFLRAHSTKEIVDMLRNHTYRDELRQCARRRARGSTIAAADAGRRAGSGGDDLRSAREMQFDKAVTPSDVGKLNRLVLPKQHAEKHFPLRCGGGGFDLACKGVLLNLEDGGCRVWRFRCSYWNSSQSYVLTKGWSRFVKENNLKAGDVVSFWRSTGPEKQLYVDCSTGGGNVVAVQPAIRPLPKSVMLFGVDISGSPASGRDGKRGRDLMELLPPSQQQQRLIKKQLI